MDFATAIGAGASAAAVGGALVASYRVTASKYKRTIGSRRDLIRRFNKLGLSVTRAYIEELFGEPAFRRDTEREGHQESIYQCGYAWLIVWYDANDAVTLYSITVTNRRFTFDARWLTFDELHVRLGESTFADVSPIPSARSIFIGANFHHIGEGYYFGRPAAYLNFVLGNANVGYGKIDFSSLHDAGISSWVEDDRKSNLNTAGDPSSLIPFRAGTVIDTLTVTKLDESCFVDDVIKWTAHLAETVRPLRMKIATRRSLYPWKQK